MSLTEIMSSAGLTVYPIVAMVLFLVAFGIVLGRTLSRRGSRELQEHAAMALRDDGADTKPTRASSAARRSEGGVR